MAVKVDLKPRRELLNSEFDGYKLSLDKLATYSKSLTSDIYQVTLSDEQYSYHHAKILGVHNHLYLDDWYPDSIYLINTRGQVIKLQVQSGNLGSEVNVLQIPDVHPRDSSQDQVHASLIFVSEELAVLSDGMGKLYVVNTGSRNSSVEWKIAHTLDVADGTPFLLSDANLHSQDASALPRIDCLCTFIRESSEEITSPFVTTVTWITLSQAENQKWCLERNRQLIGRKPFDYLAIDTDGSAVVIAAEAEYVFTSDSLHPVEEEMETEQPSSEVIPEYTWHQTQEDVTVQFTVPVGVNKADIYFTLTSDRLEFGIKNGRSLLTGQLHNRVEIDTSTWTKSGQRLELHLEKTEPGMWPVVVIGDTRGEMTVDPATVAEIHERLAHLTSEEWNAGPEGSASQPYNAQQLEDCDAFPDDDSILIRLDGNSHKVTHKTNLGSHQWLFNAQLDKSKMPAICLRHDVDGLVWQPETVATETSQPWQHIGTFNAFGYVQASKQQRKFTSCPSSLDYVAVCDCVRHIYIYRQPSAISTPIRNRKTGRTVDTVAKQQVVAVESVDNIIGFQTTNDKMFVATRNMVYAIRLESG